MTFITIRTGTFAAPGNPPSVQIAELVEATGLYEVCNGRGPNDPATPDIARYRLDAVRATGRLDGKAFSAASSASCVPEVAPQCTRACARCASEGRADALDERMRDTWIRIERIQASATVLIDQFAALHLHTGLPWSSADAEIIRRAIENLVKE